MRTEWMMKCKQKLPSEKWLREVIKSGDKKSIEYNKSKVEWDKLFSRWESNLSLSIILAFSWCAGDTKNFVIASIQSSFVISSGVGFWWENFQVEKRCAAGRYSDKAYLHTEGFLSCSNSLSVSVSFLFDPRLRFYITALSTLDDCWGCATVDKALKKI